MYLLFLLDVEVYCKGASEVGRVLVVTAYPWAGHMRKGGIKSRVIKGNGVKKGDAGRGKGIGKQLL